MSLGWQAVDQFKRAFWSIKLTTSNSNSLSTRSRTNACVFALITNDLESEEVEYAWLLVIFVHIFRAVFSKFRRHSLTAAMVKLLMRADTHVSFTVPAEEPVAKCTFSQVYSFILF